MFHHPIKEIDAEFIAEEKYLDSIQRTVKESCVAASIPQKEITSILLAIEEGATNIIRHAYLYEKGVFRLRIVIYKKMIVFSLIDFGRSFRPSGVGNLDLQNLVESGRKGGLGFYMIQKIMDSVEYISTAGFNELRMIKRINPSPSVGRSFLRRMFTLRVKFSFWTFFIMLIIIGTSIYYFDYQTSRRIYAHKNETIRALAKTIADQATGYFINSRTDVEFDDMIVSYRRANPELKLIVLTNANGVIRAHSSDIQKIRKIYKVPKGIDGKKFNVIQPIKIGNESLNYLIVPIKTGNNLLGAVHIIYSTADIYNELTAARKRIFVLTVVLIMFGILGIYLLSDYFVKPILKITHRVRRFTSGDLEAELPLEGAEEFFEISRAFNQMMTRLSQDQKNIIEKERMAKEIEVASEIQKTLLPHQFPIIPKLQVDAFYRAASIVGGDLYDIFKIDENHYCFVVADVSGKGVPASLVMSMLRTVIQIYSFNITSAKDIMIKVNNYLKNNTPPGMFVTVFLVIYNVSERAINFVSAGHNPMLYYHCGKKEISKINPKGMPLGLPVAKESAFENSLEEVTLTLENGDLFFIFTDGVTEAIDREGHRFGIKRLEEFMKAYLDSDEVKDVKKLTKTIIDHLDDYTGFVKANDDITFILAQYDFSINDNHSTQKEMIVEQIDIKDEDKTTR